MNVKLTWTDRNTNETGHRIYRSSSPMDTQALPPPVAELGPNVTEWEDTDTPVDQVVYYIVSAVRGAEEAFSDEVMIDTAGANDPYWDNVVALLHFDGDLTDETGRTWASLGNVSFDPGVFGDALSASSGGRAVCSDLTDVHFDSDYCIEAWVLPSTVSAQYATISTKRQSGQVHAEFVIRLEGDRVGYGLTSSSNWFIRQSVATISAGVGFWIALVKDGTQLKLYLNGALDSFLTVPLTPTFSPEARLSPVSVGALGDGTEPLSGKIDELRITKGVARYTGNFTPPTEPFPNFGPPPGPTPTLPTVIGEAFGGGFYGGDIQYPDGQWYKLIVADISADITGENSRWKTLTSATAGTDSLTDGVANTSAMIASGIDLHPAANHCVNHTGGGNSDWYMPAKDEMNVIHQNLAFGQPNCPPDFLSGGSQAFSNAWYWTSTQISSGYGWAQHLNGSQDGSTKTFANLRVRPVRRIAFTP